MIIEKYDFMDCNGTWIPDEGSKIDIDNKIYNGEKLKKVQQIYDDINKERDYNFYLLIFKDDVELLVRIEV